MSKLTLEQQLNLCELLALSYENSDKSLKTAETIISTIYRISHLNGTCENEHLDWHKEGKGMGVSFSRVGIGNYNKMRKRKELNYGM